MHRSATSLAANVLRHAGLDIGDHFNGAGPGNRRGHFEDLEIWQLHEEMLAAAGETPFSVRDDFAPTLDGGFESRAEALVAARASRQPWGWKDPRTCLFLALWERLVPDAGYLVLYRHPVDVVLSLLRRNTEPELWDEPLRAFEVWSVYNRRLLHLVESRRERCLVVQAPALSGDLEGLVETVAARFSLPLASQGVDAAFAAGELTGSVEVSQRAPWERVIPEALELYRRLDELADVPSSAAQRSAERDATTVGDGDRHPSELRVADALLFELLEARILRRQQRAATEQFARALEEERSHAAELRREIASARQRAAEMEARHLDSSRRRDELDSTLDRIERSRSYALVRSWWRIVGRLREGRTRGGED